MWHTAMALWIIGLLSPVDWLRRRPAVGAHAPAPADRRPRGAAHARRAAQPRAGVLPAAARARAAGAARAGCARRSGTLRQPLVALPDLRARALRLAPRRSCSRRRCGIRSCTRSSTRRSSRSACWSGGRCSSPSAGGCAGELWKIGHILVRALPRHVPRDGLRVHPPPDLHGRLRAAASARWGSSRSPTSSSPAR